MTPPTPGRRSGSSSSSSPCWATSSTTSTARWARPIPWLRTRAILESRPFDEIILATLPAGGASKWLRLDLAHRLQRVTKLPVEEVAGEEPDAAEAARLAALRFPGVPAAGEAGDPVRVLLVEDDEGDAELTRLALARCPTPSTLDTVGDGAAAIDWLRRTGGPSGVDIVLVDLKMPVLDGFELLERLNAEHDLEQLAVVVLTTSSRMEDRERAHALGAHAYVTKETSFPLYRDLLEGLLSDVVRTPPLDWGPGGLLGDGGRRFPSVAVAAGDAWQREPERRALARRRLHADGAAVTLDDPLGGGQPDAGAAQLGPLLGPGEDVEHLGRVLGRDADAVVGDRDPPPRDAIVLIAFRGAGRHDDRYRPGRVAILGRVVDEVLQHLVEQRRVALHRWELVDAHGAPTSSRRTCSASTTSRATASSGTSSSTIGWPPARA